MRFICDVCRTVFEQAGPYVPGYAGAIELGHRWRLELCADCVAHVIERAPDEATRVRLQRQAEGHGE